MNSNFFNTVSLCCPSPGRTKFQVCIFLRQEKNITPQPQLGSGIVRVFLNRVSLAYLWYFIKKNPLTICEHCPHSLISEASTWLALVFSNHLFLVLITPSHTALTSPCGYILLRGSIYC